MAAIFTEGVRAKALALFFEQMPNYRVYFNKASEQPWSIDDGSQISEITVISIRLHHCNADSHWDPSVEVNPDTPCAWFEIYHAVMQLDDGVAHFFKDPHWRVPPIAGDK